jgi:hypothetical protein
MQTNAQLLDGKARQLAKTLLHTEGEVLTTLMEMSRQRVFAELNYSGVFDYCLRALNFSKEQSYYFKKVAEVSVEVPELKTAIVKGELSLSTARRIAPVLNKQNQTEWIEKAKTMKQADLEKAVTEVNPQAHPKERIKPVAKNISELRVAIDDETDQNLTVLKDLLSQKLRRPANLADVIAWAARETREKHDPEKKAQRSRKISAGNSSATTQREIKSGLADSKTQATSRPPMPTPPAWVTARPGPKRKPIPAAHRHAVVAREGARCSYTSPDKRRCEQRRWLDIHHITPVSKGGNNEIGNLTWLCHAHHKLRHSYHRLHE